MKNVNLVQVYRDQFGITQEELGKRVGVTRQTIAAWEKGERSPSLMQIFKIAQALQVPAELLLKGEEDEQEATLLFRADDPKVLVKELRLFLSRRAEDYAMIERLVGEVPVLPESRPLEGYDPYTIEKVAVEIRDWLGVEETPLCEVFSLLEAKGLKIILHALPEKVSGFSAYTEAWGGVIFVNQDHPPERQYFTVLHELAHLIFHRREYDVPTPKAKRGDPREKAAQHFAAAVLLPRRALEGELHGYRNAWLPEPLLVDLKRRYRVSVRTILFRAADVGIISREQAGKQVGILNKVYGKTAEPGEVQPCKSLSRLERLVFNALYQEKVTTSRAAEILNRPLMEVRQELAKWLRQDEVEGTPI